MFELGYIAGFFVERFLNHAPGGMDREALLRVVGLPPGTAVQPDQKIQDFDFFNLVEQIAACVTRPL